MTMRTDIAKRLHTALAERKPTQKEKWAYNTLKKLSRSQSGPTAAELRKLAKVVDQAEQRTEETTRSTHGRRPDPRHRPPRSRPTIETSKPGQPL